MNLRAGLILVLVGLVLVLLASTYTIDEREQVVITQFGRPVSGTITDAGLHFKLPFIQEVNRFDKRWLEWDGEVDESRTAEKTPILLDTFARWRIIDALKFLEQMATARMGSEEYAQTILDDIILPETLNVIAANKLIEVVRSTDRVLPVDGELASADEEKDEAKALAVSTGFVVGRYKLTREILQRIQGSVGDYGIEVVDIQFQRVNYTAPVEKKNFERMISERKRIASGYIAEGKEESAKIHGEITEKLLTIRSTAYRTVQEIKGAADAEATAIYASAYNLDPGLYRLLKSLEGYEQSIDEDTWLILSTDSDYFKAMKSMR